MKKLEYLIANKHLSEKYHLHFAQSKSISVKIILGFQNNLSEKAQLILVKDECEPVRRALAWNKYRILTDNVILILSNDPSIDVRLALVEEYYE